MVLAAAWTCRNSEVAESPLTPHLDRPNLGFNNLPGWTWGRHLPAAPFLQADPA